MNKSDSTNINSAIGAGSNKTIFKEQSINLLNKIEGLHNQIQGNKMNKFKNFLNEIASMQNSVNRSTAQKRQLYQNLMQQITRLGKETEEQYHQDQKIRVQIQNKLESFIKNNDRAFQKLKSDRLATQQRLIAFLDNKIQSLVKKCQSYKAPQIPLQQYKQQLQTIRKQVISFFKQAQKQQQKVRGQVFKIIQQCSNLLKDNQNQKIQLEALQYMRVIKLQVGNRVSLMAQARTRMQQDVLSVLERVYQVTASEATSTLI